VALNRHRTRGNTAATPEPEPRAQEATMNRAKLLMFTAVLMACAGFLMLSQSVHAGHDDFYRTADLGLVPGR
jgi:hypothetical protein